MPQKGARRFNEGVCTVFGLGAASVAILFAIQRSSPRAQGPGSYERMLNAFIKVAAKGDLPLDDWLIWHENELWKAALRVKNRHGHQVFFERVTQGSELESMACASAVLAIWSGLRGERKAISAFVESYGDDIRERAQGRYPSGSPELRLFEQVWTLRVEPQ